MNKLWVPKMIKCAVCGKETLASHNRTLYCTECKKIRARENNTKRRARARAKKRRLNNEVVEPREIHYCDSPEKIQMCLNCTKQKCTNCLQDSETPKRKPYVISDEVKKQVAAFARNGMKQREIAKHFGVSEPTVSRWITGLRLEGAI